MADVTNKNTGLIGRQLTAFMKSQHISQSELARRTGISRSAVRRIVDDNHAPDLKQLQDICDTLSLATIDDLIHGDPIQARLTGHEVLDQFLLEVVRLRSAPPGASLDEAAARLHAPNAMCYSPHYDKYLDKMVPLRGRPLKDDPDLIGHLYLKTDDLTLTTPYHKPHQREAATLNGSPEPLERLCVYRHPEIDDMIGITMADELSLNAANNKQHKRHHIYSPVSAYITGPRRINVVTVGHLHATGQVTHSIEDLVLTAQVETILKGSADPCLRAKLWRTLPDFYSRRESVTLNQFTRIEASRDRLRNRIDLNKP